MADSNSNIIKPCLVQTAQGFTVSYREKFLYSKYNPSKAILNIIENLNIQPQTIVLCISPLLPYGIKKLSQKLPDDCIMLACEYESQLYKFMLENVKAQDFSNVKNFSYLTRNELLELGPLLSKKKVTLQSGFTLPQPGSFRRIMRLDFSAGSQFNADLYDKVIENATNALMTFWANRVTLVKFGRKYCSNFFKNLIYCADTGTTVPIQKYFASVEKPIIVFGAGESLQEGVDFIKKSKGKAGGFFIICADTALQPLIAQGIIPDGVFIEEAQNVICKCFIGTQNQNIHIFAGLSSVHSLTRYFKPEQISYFTTEFTQASFIDRFEKEGILPPKNHPFGSVGITAYYYANVFRKNASVPVYTYGLDFAYSAGRTHTKGAMADNARFMNSSRIKNDANFGAAFCEPAVKNGNMFTTPILQRYADLMMALRQAQGPQTQIQGPQTQKHDGVPELVEGQSQKLKNYLQKEKESLEELKALLTGEKQVPPEELEREITALVTEREYLYLHFPDGHKFVYTQSFLNRIRIEVDYYLKVLS